MAGLIEFFEKFFESLGCKIQKRDFCLIVEDVPANFEKFSGKKSPYYFSFESETAGYELINANHYLIKSMKEFLEGRGETTLLKMDVQFAPKEEIPKLIPFRNCTIKNISKTSKNDFIFRFSFASIFQYLNDREQIINHLYIKNGEIINFDESIPLSEGNKKEISDISIDKEYETAKLKLKGLIEPKVKEISQKLNEQLDKEISRIKEHYKNRLGEINQQKELLNRQIKESNGEKKKKFEKMLQKIEEENLSSAEEQTFIDGEKKKHGLSIKNKLINASVIYFPILNLNLMLESGKANRIIQMEYDSLKKELLPLFCSTCNSKLDEIILCSSGHLTCKNCGDKCVVCDGVFCKSCSQFKCNYCERKICSQCANVCASCKKTFCKNHLYPFDAGRKLCHNCMKKCDRCGKIIEPELARIAGHKFCLKCSNKENRMNIMKNVFG